MDTSFLFQVRKWQCQYYEIVRVDISKDNMYNRMSLPCFMSNLKVMLFEEVEQKGPL